MKKLVLLLFLTIVSFGSMAMGFPHSTFSQQRALVSKSKKIDFIQQAEQVKANIANKMESQKNSFIEAIVDKIGNFLMHIFANPFSSQKSYAVNDLKFKSLPCIKTSAIKTENIIIG